MPPRSHALAFISAMSSALEVPEYAVADEVRVDTDATGEFLRVCVSYAG